MPEKMMYWATYAVDVMFFTGLVGCAGVVLFSWVSIFKSAFSDRDED
jgi:hypothetical protein